MEWGLLDVLVGNGLAGGHQLPRTPAALSSRRADAFQARSRHGAFSPRAAAPRSGWFRTARTAHSHRSRRSKWIFCRTQGEFSLRSAAKKITLALPCYTGEGCRNGTWLKAAESAATRPAASKTKKAAANKALPEEERSQRKNRPGHPARQERRDERSSRRFLLRPWRRQDATHRRSGARAAPPAPSCRPVAEPALRTKRLLPATTPNG
jgi:hypothetical protein